MELRVYSLRWDLWICAILHKCVYINACIYFTYVHIEECQGFAQVGIMMSWEINS